MPTEPLTCSLEVPPLRARQLRLGRHQAALACGLEDGGAVEFQSCRLLCKVHYGPLEDTKGTVDNFDNSCLFWHRWEREAEISNVLRANRWIERALNDAFHLADEFIGLDGEEYPL